MRSTSWKPYPALKVTAALHAAGAAALVAQPALWPGVAAALLANHAVLFAACMMPRSRVLGPNLVRLPAAAAARGEVALTFDDGPDPEITPRVLDLLEKAGARATFFCIGERAAAQPRLMREIVARGHAAESHSLRHTLGFGWYGPGRLRREVVGAQRAITDACGVSPVFFRAPFGVRNPMLDQVLARAGLRYATWTRRGYDTRDDDSARVLRRLVSGLRAGDVLMLHDGYRGRDPGSVLARLLDELAARGLRSVTLREALR
jgi:peptidoglycan/xylan/chitin deacetylase (PgdA/CDA1 family)